MKRLSLFAAVLSALGCAASAQTEFDPNEGLRLTSASAGTYNLQWYAKPGRTYFIRVSTDLFSWTYLPEIIAGSGLVESFGINSDAEKFFVRLQYSDAPYDDDMDDDGVTNLLELTQNTDPTQIGYLGDLDGDGISDADELTAGTDPLRRDNPSVELSVFGFTTP